MNLADQQGGPAPAPPDGLGDRLAAPAVALAGQWLIAAAAGRDRAAARVERRLHQLSTDPADARFTMAFCDRVLRPESPPVAAQQLRALAAGPLPRFLSPPDRLLLRAGAQVSRLAPGVVLSAARRRVRQLVGSLVLDADGPALGRQLERLSAAGYAVNVNLLGESVLGEDQARRHRTATLALLARPDVRYLSVKASSVACQLNLWGYEDTLERVKAGLRELFEAAGAHRPAKFVNVDMEEYKDLDLTLDAFSQLLDEPALRGLEAGIAVQAYLPDSFGALQRLVEWAGQRASSGGGGIKIRVVKGANLALERVDAAMHGWAQAPYATKAGTDANYTRMLDWALHPSRLAGVRIGVASHNVFDVAWAHLLAGARQVDGRVEFEMLQGMAPAMARQVRQATGGLLLYAPVVGAADFDNALAYLFRRLEENSAEGGFLRHAAEMAPGSPAFAAEAARFAAAVADRWQASCTPRRRAPATPLPAAPADWPPAPADWPAARPFTNTPDADPTDPAARHTIVAALHTPPEDDAGPEADCAAVRDAVAAARHAWAQWRTVSAADRQALLHRMGDELSRRRAQLIAVMAQEAGKPLGEANTEVSEAVDAAHYYAEQIPLLETMEGAAFSPLGVVAVVPPWNFPVAIPAGGVAAALAAGNAVILKPAPEAPRCARAVAEACWAAGVPRGALQFVRCADIPAGQYLIERGGLDGIILTGSADTAERFHRLAPSTPLFAETSGKNAIVVMPDADVDLAVADLVHSAFGHAGQKCSAASLAICVGAAATSQRFRRQLADATRSLIVGPAQRPETVVGPLIGPPGPPLRRALRELDPGQGWLVAPRLLDAEANLWSPGIIDGVRPGSWFHRTECFGPVLGLMAARDLDEALAWQNGTDFGLTAGLHSLDSEHQERWLARAEAGNLYINRSTTGAIIGRQPFGGWKRSVAGPGAKAGGPNYLLQLGTWRDTAESGPADPAAELRQAHTWWRNHFGVDHHLGGLFCESNVLRYRPFPRFTVRFAAGARPLEIARVAAAVEATGTRADFSADPAVAGRCPPGTAVETTAAFAARMTAGPPERIRCVGSEALPGLGSATYVDRRPPLGNGRIELLRYVREQSVSRTLHRFGNLVAAGPPLHQSH